MRSKEVSNAIDLLENGIADYIIEFYCTQQEKDKQLCGTYCEKMKEDCIYNQAIDKVIEYIEELEKMIPTPSNEVPLEYQTLILVDKKDAVMKSEIRDKIKFLENRAKEYGYYKTEIEYARNTLQEIIGE